jgi:hypothetical protein
MALPLSLPDKIILQILYSLYTVDDNFNQYGYELLLLAPRRPNTCMLFRFRGESA